MDQQEQKENLWTLVIVVVLIFVFAFTKYYWDEITDFLEEAFWITSFVLITLLVSSGTIWMLNRYGITNFHPLSGRVRRFKKWHIIKRIIAYRIDPQKLSNAVENIDHLDEFNTKVEHRSLTNMAHELKEAESDYNQAIRRCNGSKAAEKAVKEAYIQRCARIREKYNA